jgi:hypothetical protein
MNKLMVAYDHDSADFSSIYLAVAPRGVRPVEDDWRSAFRDTEAGTRVIWARMPEPGPGDVVWVRDRDGARHAKRLTT